MFYIYLLFILCINIFLINLTILIFILHLSYILSCIYLAFIILFILISITIIRGGKMINIGKENENLEFIESTAEFND